MRSLFLLAIFLILSVLGLTKPYIAGICYIWIDFLVPQQLAYSIISGWPLSMIAGILTLLSFIADGIRIPKKIHLIFYLLIILSVWITFTTTWAVAPTMAWNKWDWAFKGILFSSFMPFIFRNRIQIETGLYAMVFTVGVITLSAGTKTIFGGGGYGSLGILAANNSGIGESSTLAAISVSLIPIALYLYKHTKIDIKYRKIIILFIITSYILTIIGTFARTGLIGLGFLLSIYITKSKKKISYLIIFSFAVLSIISFLPEGYLERMSTIQEYENDSSAMGRISVWTWTVEYIVKNPLGGGFHAYVINQLGGVDQYGNLTGKAFHSIYFEVLGEHGIPGFIIFLAILIYSLFRMFKIKKIMGEEGRRKWSYDLADALVLSIGSILVSGLFIGIAFQPFIYYFIAFTVCLDQNVKNVWKIN